MQLQKNDHVRHTKVPDWGLGKVVHTSENGYVDIHFSQAGHKRLKMASAPLQKISSEQAEAHITNYLLESNQKPPSIPTRLQQCVQAFKRLFPKGFRDPRYIEGQRTPRIHDQHRFLAAVSQPQLNRLLQEDALGELRARFGTILSQSPLLFPKEKQAALNAIQSPADCRHFARSVYELSFGHSDWDSSFLRWCTTLTDLQADKWAVATLFPFLAQPQQHIFIRPAACQKTAMCTQTRLRYRAQPNIHTYTDIHNMTRTLRRQLKELQPRDLIDIQAFITLVPHLVRQGHG